MVSHPPPFPSQPEFLRQKKARLAMNALRGSSEPSDHGESTPGGRAAAAGKPSTEGQAISDDSREQRPAVALERNAPDVDGGVTGSEEAGARPGAVREQGAAPGKRKLGRPKGSKNKSKGATNAAQPK